MFQELKPGRTLGEYELVRQMGRGPLATVWMAYRSRDGRQMALKVLEQRYAENPDRRERFEHEARLAQSLVHPRIVLVHEVLMPPAVPLPMFVMDLLPGGSIGQFRGSPAAQFGAVTTLLAQVCEALSCIHDRGLVHCDVKASNILLDDAGQAYLADFGMTGTPDDIAQEGPRGGTILYMSPEQFASLSEGPDSAHPVDARSDIYSLGVLMYELFTAEPPFRASNRFALMYQRLTAIPRTPSLVRPEIPQRLSQAILKALAREPADRFASANELAKALTG